MLPPVLASANQAATATEARQRPDPVATARPTTIAQSGAPGPIDQNSAIAGQLNIMLLSGPERMSQNLAALADILGSALKIERRIDESVNDYMGRLIEGIAALPIGDRVKLQKLLAQAFAGLQLRTMLEAMANPSGPERATLALYLELYRQKDGDGATRSVISSYRELAGEGRSNLLSPGRPAAANDSLRSASEPARPAARAVLPAPITSSALPSGNPELSESRPPSPSSFSDQRPVAATRREVPPAAPSGVSGASTIRAERPLDTTAIRRLSISAAVKGASGSVLLSPPGHSLSAEAGSSAERMGQPQASGRTSIPGNRSAEPAGERTREATGPSERALQSASSVFQATHVTEVKTGLPPSAGGWLAELLESDFVRTLLQLKTLPVDQFRTAQGGGPEKMTPAELEPPSREMPDGFSEETELQPDIQETGRASGAADTEPPSLPIPLAEQAAIRPMLAREAVPLPFVSYMIDDDVEWDEEVEDEDEDEGDREAGDERHPKGEGQEAGEEPSEEVVASVGFDRDPGDHEVTPALPQGDAKGTRALPSPSEPAMRLPPEPAHELYLRMAGLS